MQSSSVSRKHIFAFLLLSMAVMALIAVFCAIHILPERGNRFDFYPHWVAGRAVWSGQTPYQAAVTERIQLGMFGELLPPEANQHRFAYPAYTSILLAPLLLLSANWAIPLWMALQLWALLVTPLLWLSIVKPKSRQPSPLLIALVLLGLVVLFRYPMIVFVLGQFTGTMLLLLSLGVLLLLRRQDAWAGLAFALAAAPPTVSGPLALIILGGFGVAGRWRGLLAYIATLAAVTLLSIALIGWWLPDFINTLTIYPQYATLVWPPALLGSSSLAALLCIAAITWLIWLVFKFKQSPQHHNAIHFILVAFTVCLLLFPQTGSYYLSLLIPVWVYAFTEATRGRAVLPGMLLVAAILSPWAYRMLPEPGIEMLWLPLHAAVLLGLSIAASSRQRVDNG